MNLLYVFIGGGLGAVCRWVASVSFGSTSGFPWATFTANVLGCFLIGLAAFFITSNGNRLHLLLMVGFLGGFTTFSTYGMELVNLFKADQFKLFVMYFLMSNLLGLLSVVIGYKLASVLSAS